MANPTVSDFRIMFPRFTDELFPDDAVQTWLNVAISRLPENIWKTAWPLGCFLYAAHELELEKYADKYPNGALLLAGGTVSGVSKTTGSLAKSESRNGTLTALNNQGYYGLTIYGQRFYKLVRIYGARVMQV